MCRYFSGIVTKKGEVLWLKDGDAPMSHESIKQAHGLKNSGEGEDFVLFEIIPDVEKLLTRRTRSELTVNDWTFRVDGPSTPDWFAEKSAAYMKKAYEALKESWKIHLLLGDEFLQELKDKGFIAWMWGTSKVGEMRGTSKVGEMRGTSKVGVMWGTSQVGEMRETSQVGEMRETSQVGMMYETSKVGMMRETSKVGMMRETSKVGVMRGTSKVGVMYETSQVGEMRETSQVGEMRETSQVGEMRETSQVGEMRETSKVGEINDFSTAVKDAVLYVAKDVTVKKSGKVAG